MAKLIVKNNHFGYSRQTAELLQTLPESYTIYTGAVRALMTEEPSEFLVVGPTGIFGLETAEAAGKYKGVTDNGFLFFTAVDSAKAKQVTNPLNAAVLNSGSLSGILRRKGLPCTMQYAAYFPAATELDIKQTSPRFTMHPFSSGEALLQFITGGETVLSESDVAAICAAVESL